MESLEETVKTSISRTGANETDQGFTILEFLIVICIAGLVSAAFAFSMTSMFSRSQFEAIAAELEGEFSRAADVARQSGRDQIVYVRPFEHFTTFAFGRTTIRVSEPISAGWVAAAAAGTSSELGVIVFFGAGGSSGGTLELADERWRATIEIDWLSGRVRTTGGRL